jgi:hypothetical protein
MKQVLKILILLLPLFARAQQNPVDSMYNDLAQAILIPQDTRLM